VGRVFIHLPWHKGGGEDRTLPLSVEGEEKKGGERKHNPASSFSGIEREKGKGGGKSLSLRATGGRKKKKKGRVPFSSFIL